MAARRSGALATPTRLRRGQLGQALPLFALMIFVVTGSVAVVTDVSWFWVNVQRMQRAADAGALAGAVYLPGNVGGAYAAARAATAQNGYTDGVNGVTITPTQEANNHRRLDVTVSGPINTFFARVFGMTSVNGSATSKAEFTLPVPMGSPQNYYGVGTFLHSTQTSSTSTANTPGTTDWVTSGSVPSTVWTTPANANGTSDTNYAVSGSASGSAQQWQNFGLTTGATPEIPVPGSGQTLTITGLQLELRELLTGSGTSTTCQLQAALSWDGGTTWSTTQTITPLSTTKTLTTLGSTSSTASWGGHTWVSNDFSNANFRVRLTFNKPSCGASRTVSVDTLRVQVSYNMATTTTSTSITCCTQQNITSPTGGSLTSQGFWGAIITLGGNRQNGDEFSPQNDTAGIGCGPAPCSWTTAHTSSNAEHDSLGYDYTFQSGSNGQIQIFDPTFCETGPNGSGGNLGAGDHWIAGSPNPVSTLFTLWNENGTPYDITDDTLVATSGTLFNDQAQADYSGNMGTPAHSGLTDCSTDPYHNAWWQMATGLSSGRYRLNVLTTNPNNASANAENMWSVWVNSGGNPQIYGEGRMAAYNNLTGGAQLFYLAQIGSENAGKTMEIQLFDPGDVSGDAYLRILDPDGNAYNYATFSYQADNGRSGTNVTSIQTASAANGSYFNDALITIDVPLPATYGTTGLTPSGETQAGWWKIEYTVNGGNDTTTWQVGIRGSPVHLVH